MQKAIYFIILATCKQVFCKKVQTQLRVQRCELRLSIFIGAINMLNTP